MVFYLQFFVPLPENIKVCFPTGFFNTFLYENRKSTMMIQGLSKTQKQIVIVSQERQVRLLLLPSKVVLFLYQTYSDNLRKLNS